MTAALALIALGNALFRPTLSALLCLLYPPQDARLPTAQTVLYVVANLGGLLGALGAGVLLHLVGRGSPFRLATCAMGLGCLILQRGSRALQTRPSVSPASCHRFQFWQHDAVMFLAILLATALLSLCFGQVEGALLLEFSRSIAPLKSSDPRCNIIHPIGGPQGTGQAKPLARRIANRPFKSPMRTTSARPLLPRSRSWTSPPSIATRPMPPIARRYISRS